MFALLKDYIKVTRKKLEEQRKMFTLFFYHRKYSSFCYRDKMRNHSWIYSNSSRISHFRWWHARNSKETTLPTKSDGRSHRTRRTQERHLRSNLNLSLSRSPRNILFFLNSPRTRRPFPPSVFAFENLHPFSSFRTMKVR